MRQVKQCTVRLILSAKPLKLRSGDAQLSPTPLEIYTSGRWSVRHSIGRSTHRSKAGHPDLTPRNLPRRDGKDNDSLAVSPSARERLEPSQLSTARESLADLCASRSHENTLHLGQRHALTPGTPVRQSRINLQHRSHLLGVLPTHHRRTRMSQRAREDSHRPTYVQRTRTHRSQIPLNGFAQYNDTQQLRDRRSTARSDVWSKHPNTVASHTAITNTIFTHTRPTPITYDLLTSLTAQSLAGPRYSPPRITPVSTREILHPLRPQIWVTRPTTTAYNHESKTNELPRALDRKQVATHVPRELQRASKNLPQEKSKHEPKT